MKHLSLFSLVAASALLTGCATSEKKYTHIVVTTHGGEPVSEWVAEGAVRKHELGYTIKAVERHVGGDESNPPVDKRYPNGWATMVTGPNITLEPIDKPQWLVELDAMQPQP